MMYYPARSFLSLRSILVPVGALLFGAATIQPAFSQELEEVVVTASKRGAVVAQDLAMSITAYNQETLEAMGVQEFTDFSRMVAGLDVVDFGPSEKRYMIRGLNLPGEATVGVYYDSVPVLGTGNAPGGFGGAQADFDLFDTERVEVLRGPQGTLYGTNSVNGVVRVISNKPDTSGTYGSVFLNAAAKKDGEPDWGAKAMINFPLSDSFAARLVAYTTEIGGFIDNNQLRKAPGCYAPQAPNPEVVLIDAPGCNDGSINYEDINGSTRDGARLSLKWDINDRSSLLLQGSYQDSHTDGRTGADPIGAVNAGPGFVRPVRGGSNLVISEAAGERISTIKTLEENNDDVTIFALEYENDFDWGTLNIAASSFDRDRHNVLDSSNAARLHRSFKAAAFPPPIRGGVVSPTDRLPFVVDTSTDVTSIEARLASGFDGPVNFLAGLFYQDIDRTSDSIGLSADPATGEILTNAQVLAVMIPSDRALVAGYPWYQNGTEPFNVTHRTGVNSTEIKAIYGEVYWDITEQIELMGGLRYFETDLTSEEEIIVPFNNSPGIQGSPPGVFTGEPANESDTLFKAQATWRFSEDAQVYFQVAEGYRAGGVNAQIVSTIPQQFDSDQTFNLELGAKASWMDGRLLTNLYLFQTDWENVQFAANFTQQFTGLLNCTEQSDPVQSKGFEITAHWLATDNLDLGVDFISLDADWQLDALSCVSPAIEPDLFDPDDLSKAGISLIGVPDYSGSAFAQYNFPDTVLGGDNGFIRLDVAFQGEVKQNDNNEAINLPSPSYALVNLNTGLDFGAFGVQLYVRNLFDEKAWFALRQGFQTANRVTPSQPRTIGVNLTYAFGER